MTATLEPLAADEVYDARIEPLQHTRARRAARAALDLWCALSGGLLELSRAGDVVVRRRVDAVEELRVPAGPPETALPLLQSVREDLASLSPQEFRAAWGLA